LLIGVILAGLNLIVFLAFVLQTFPGIAPRALRRANCRRHICHRDLSDEELSSFVSATGRSHQPGSTNPMYYLRQFIEALLYPLRALLTSPGKVTSSARRLAAISLPARIRSWRVFLVFVVCRVFRFSARRLFGQLLSPAARWIGSVILVIAIPIVLYYVLRLWLEGEVSAFRTSTMPGRPVSPNCAQRFGPGIHSAVLILGSRAKRLEKGSLRDATAAALRESSNRHAAHWFAEPNGIYLVCTDVGCLASWPRS
jgi:hypothetical protein